MAGPMRLGDERAVGPDAVRNRRYMFVSAHFYVANPFSVRWETFARTAMGEPNSRRPRTIRDNALIQASSTEKSTSRIVDCAPFAVQ
jgi:hypothetical protein